MRLGRPVNQQNYPIRYNPIVGRRSITENTGIFKNTARMFGLGALLKYDQPEQPQQSAVLANKTLTTSFDGLKIIGNFLKKFNNKPLETFKIESENGKNFISIGLSYDAKHEFKKKKNYYYFFPKKVYKPNIPESRNKNIPIIIQANNDDEFKQKLHWILSNPASRAKLDYNPTWKRITFNEQKIIGHSQIQQFTRIGDPALSQAFDTEIGGIDPQTVNYFCRMKSYQGYSALEKENLTKVVDKFSDRIHGMNEHFLSSNRIDELLGNVVNMFYAGKNITPENRAQTVKNMREDFIFNLYGKGSRNGRANQEEKNLFSSPSKFQSFFPQFLLLSNPYRGGRFRDIPPSLPQVMTLMYRSTGNGGIEHLYDVNREQYLKNMRDLKIKISDKQFMAAYGRKILGIYLALKFIKHDLSFIKLDDKNITPKEIQKWRDLTKIHDELFESAGDLKDFLRHNSSGFAQVTDSVKLETIPNIKSTMGLDTENDITQETYQKTAKKTLYPLMLNYTQFENFMGWRTRERGSSILYNAFKNNIFDREVPDIVAGAATVMLLDGLDKISRRLKFIDEMIGADGNLKGAVTQFINKAQQGNIDGAYELMTRQGKKLTSILTPELLFPNIKYHSLQTEGLLWEREIIRPIIRDYQTENTNFFVGNHLSLNIIEKNGQILTAKLVEAIKMQARLIKNIQTEMQEKGLKSPYETQAMLKLSQYMRSAAKEIATSFMHEHQSYFTALNNEEIEKIFRDVFKETYGLQELIGNVASVLATGKEHSYGNNLDYSLLDKKRNQTLSKNIITKDKDKE